MRRSHEDRMKDITRATVRRLREAGEREARKGEKLGCRETLLKSLALVILGLVLLAIGGTITHFTYSAAKPGAYYIIPVGFFIFGAIALLMALVVLIDRDKEPWK